MGGAAPSVSQPVEPEVQAAVAQASVSTLEEVASGEEYVGQWWVVRASDGKQYLGTVPNTNGQPYETDTGLSAFGANTYFFASQSDAQEVAVKSDSLAVVPLTMRCTLG